MPRARLVASLLAATLLALAVFALWPGIDLAVSAVFHVPGQGFPLADATAISAFRYAIWGTSIAMVALALVLLPAAALRRGPVLRLAARDWGFILLLYVLGPGLLVEGLLKAHSGRARPADVTQFGGTRLFTPAGEIADQCSRNCSFVAGEVAGSVVLALALALILWRWRDRIGKAACRAGLALAGVQVVLIGLQRISSGRHFLSDVVVSALLMLLVAALLLWLMRLQARGP